MEQSIWVFTGIIAVLVGVSALIVVVQQRSADDVQNAQIAAVEELADLCRSVCERPSGTRLRRVVSVPAETILVASSDRICTTGEDPYCARCDCDLPESTILDLSGAKGFFASQQYGCLAERTIAGVTLSCQG